MKKIIYFLLFVCGYTQSVFGQKKPGMLEYVYNATIRIQTIDSVVRKGNRDIVYGENGTGFFFLFETGKGKLPSIVTNKHILSSAVSISFFFVEADTAGNTLYGKEQKISFKKTDVAVFDHPDPAVDLVIIPIKPLLDYFNKQKLTVSFHPLTETVIPKDSAANTFNPLEDLYMLGYPSGLQNELRSSPFVSKGVTATPLFLDHNNKKEFLAGIPVYDGSAGAPVIVYQANSLGRYDEQTPGYRFLLAGINSGTYTKNFRERVVVPGKYPTEEQTTPQYENVCIIIKSQRLLEFKKVLSDLGK